MPETQPAPHTWHVYLLECADRTWYCGIARNVPARLLAHNGHKPGGAKYTRGRRPVQLVASVPCPSQTEALRLERVIKSKKRHEAKLAALLEYCSPE